MEATKSTRPLDPTTFEVTVTGKAEIPHHAERGLINISVASESLNKAAVSDEVITAAENTSRVCCRSSHLLTIRQRPKKHLHWHIGIRPHCQQLLISLMTRKETKSHANTTPR